MHETRVIAHRGASGWAPEHTETAVRLAARLGADAVEPDLVATRDGVLVVRHDNELSETTDVADRAAFADRRRAQVIDGHEHTGWFVEDFTWAEVATLRARERLPRLRPRSARLDGREGVLRFTDLLAIADETGLDIVAELKHASHHASLGLPLDELVADAVRGTHWMSSGRLVVESFEEGVLHEVRAAGVVARLVYLMDHDGTAADLVARGDASAPTYAQQREDAQLAALAGRVDAISVAKSVLFERDGGQLRTTDLVERARAVRLGTIAWTLRPENAFLEPEHRLGEHDAAWGDWTTEWAMLAALGLEAVFVDHPDLWRRLG
ncbi:glycerophosphodiester phosphodiesterase family protein [Agrococcus sp. HG114]|uniref:glycerophosphodiester phosphodiesterase family protein n=1 Tax=Agrococcus sp. HG114 TaxID=2969757 RepID=UPI00215A6A71|nr:glycerophosphodiester phosphodiesterase family protein [Agrococcus sp. HG114]MCR8670263.1 glycerophosphodiester phosphodiesterase [Agrococcus sp. HG114]